MAAAFMSDNIPEAFHCDASPRCQYAIFAKPPSAGAKGKRNFVVVHH